MSSGLSGSFQTASMLTEEYDGRVWVADNQRISVTQRQSVLDALMMADSGMGAAEIRDKLEESGMDATIYITVDTLKWASVKVKIVGDATLVAPTAVMTTSSAGITFPSAITIDTNKYAGNATWTVSGAKDGTNALTGSFAVNAATIPGTAWVADGTGYVTVTISDLTANSAAKNTITGLSAVDLTKPDGTKLTGGLTFAVVDNTGAQLGGAISNGTWVSAANSDNAYIKLTADNSTGAVASWDVVVKVTPVGGTAQNYTVSVPDNGSATIRSMFPMDKSYTVEVVSATAVAPLTIENQTWNNDTGILTLTFNKDVRTGFGKKIGRASCRERV